MFPRSSSIALGVVAAAVLTLAGCGDGGSSSESTHHHDGTTMSGMPGMPNTHAMGDGLQDTAAGFRFAPSSTTFAAGTAGRFTFRITGHDGTTTTVFEPDQTKLMHFYIVRSDLTGFQHVHPTMAADGTWTAPLASTPAGSYRAYASFIAKDAAGKQVPLVLSTPVTVEGPDAASMAPLPAPAPTTEVDGYTLTLSGTPMAGMSHEMTVTVTRDGKPVTDLQPYLETYAHLTGFRAGNLAFAHLHPHDAVAGDHGGPTLTFEAMLPTAGTWRLFIQFQTGGVLHTAALTVPVS